MILSIGVQFQMSFQYEKTEERRIEIIFWFFNIPISTKKITIHRLDPRHSAIEIVAQEK